MAPASSPKSDASDTALALKRKALERKKAGDIEGAKQFLTQAKTIEALAKNENPDNLRKLALLLDQHGNKEGSTRALAKAEERAFPEDPVNQAMDEANLDELSGKVTFTDEEMLDVETMKDMKDSGMDIPTAADYEAKVAACKRAALDAKNKGDLATAKRNLIKLKEFQKAIETLFSGNADEEEDDGEDYSLLDELMDDNKASNKDDDGFLEELFGISTNAISLDDLDDIDAEMLKDMMEAGMEIPKVDDVLASAQKKKAMAVQCKKDGDLVSAKAALDEAKRLDAKAKQLSDMLAAIERGETTRELDPEAALEAMLRASEAKEAPKNAEPTPEAPPAAPLKSSHEYKVEAVTAKQAGNMQEAVAALKLYKQALAAETAAQSAAQRKENLAALQQESKMVTQQLRLFTFYHRFVDGEIGALQKAAWKAYGDRIASEIATLNNSPPPPVTGDGAPAVKELQRGSLQTSHLQHIRSGDNLAFIGSTMDPTEERIEIAVLEILELQRNKNLQKLFANALVSPNPPPDDTKKAKKKRRDEDVTVDMEKMPLPDTIRLVANVQLPPNAEAPDDTVQLHYEPVKPDKKTSNDMKRGVYVFTGEDSCQYVHAERGTSRFAKLLTRRLGRKRMTVDVIYHTSTKKGFFSAPVVTETVLGTAVLELKDLLGSKVMAGEFPLLDAAGRRPQGGWVRLAVRTGSPFAPPDDGDANSKAGKKEEKKGEEEEEAAATPDTATTGLDCAVADMKPYAAYVLDRDEENHDDDDKE